MFRSLSPALQASQHAGRAGLLSDPFLLPLKLLFLEEALYPSPNKTQLPRTHMYKKNHCTTPFRLPPPVLLGLPWVTLGRVSQVGREWEDTGEGNWEMWPEARASLRSTAQLSPLPVVISLPWAETAVVLSCSLDCGLTSFMDLVSAPALRAPQAQNQEDREGQRGRSRSSLRAPQLTSAFCPPRKLIPSEMQDWNSAMV